MGTMTINCPRCGTQKIAATVLGVANPSVDNHDYVSAEVAIECHKCRKVIGVSVETKDPFRTPPAYNIIDNFIRNLKGMGDFTGLLVYREFSPQPDQIKIVDFLPDNIQKVFEEAEKSKRAKLWRGAGMLYRCALDIATKDIGRNIEGFKANDTLYIRIKKLGEASRITPDMVSWAKAIKDIGNESAHNENSPHDEADVINLANLTEMVLKYLYELPTKVESMMKAMKMRSEAKKDVSLADDFNNQAS